jgi:hypothetical protein
MIMAYRLYGLAIAALFTFMSIGGHSCSDDRNTGSTSSGGTSSSSYRTYHK